MGAPMPPKTAEAADAFRSVRREKLICFSRDAFVLEMQFYTDQTPSGHQRSRSCVGLLQRTQATAISAFGPSDACEAVVRSRPWLGVQMASAQPTNQRQS